MKRTLAVASSVKLLSLLVCLPALLFGCASSPGARRADELSWHRDRCPSVVPAGRLPRRGELAGVEVIRPSQRGKGLEPPPTGVELAFSRALPEAELRNDLSCHQVDVALGRVPLADDDPFALADDWIDFDVRYVSDRTVLREEAHGSTQAGALVERARRFAAR